MKDLLNEEVGEGKQDPSIQIILKPAATFT